MNTLETGIRHAQDSGIGQFPSRGHAVNQAWILAASIAAGLDQAEIHRPGGALSRPVRYRVSIWSLPAGASGLPGLVRRSVVGGCNSGVPQEQQNLQVARMGWGADERT